MKKIVFIVSVPLLVSCAAPQPDAEISAEQDAAIQIRTLSNAEVIEGIGSPDGQRLIADLLFAGLQALDADRLLTPVDDNAHARFQRVLAYDPDNEIALQGLQDIVQRYLELSREASRQGLFDEAEILLDRARFVDETHPGIASAEEELRSERNSGDLFFDFEATALARRSESVQEKLADIARQAREHNAFFLITAPSDDLARWMYGVMREAVNGYRLRGNIELASRATIRLRLPEGES
jgi:hypothetical protein